MRIVRASHASADVSKADIVEMLAHQGGDNRGSGLWCSVVKPLKLICDLEAFSLLYDELGELQELQALKHIWAFGAQPARMRCASLTVCLLSTTKRAH